MSNNKDIYVIELYDNLGNFTYIGDVFRSRQDAEQYLTQEHKINNNITGEIHKRQLT